MAQRLANFPIIINTAGTLSNPTTATVVADTGALNFGSGAYANTGGGIYEVLCTVSCDANASFQIQRRNAANGASVGNVPIFRCAANNTVAIPFRFEIEAGERIRIMMNANLTGNAEGSLTVQRAG